MSVTGRVWPAPVVTLSLALLSPSGTWAAVRIRPSVDMKNPLPMPLSPTLTRTALATEAS